MDGGGLGRAKTKGSEAAQRRRLKKNEERGPVVSSSSYGVDFSSLSAAGLGFLVRTYALFLEERLECFRVLKYDIEAECLPKPAERQEKVLKESFKIYCAIKDGIINLINKYFEMPRHEAITAFDIYKRASQKWIHVLI
ncbi:hypothetical protein K1719_002645 [Acacia pycnantha]|nr:hypothetical protein K1719_002645 [Acacia pycnantha]